MGKRKHENDIREAALESYKRSVAAVRQEIVESVQRTLEPRLQETERQVELLSRKTSGLEAQASAHFERINTIERNATALQKVYTEGTNTHGAPFPTYERRRLMRSFAAKTDSIQLVADDKAWMTISTPELMELLRLADLVDELKG